MAQKKARQALDRSRKVVNTKIYIYNELFTWNRKVLDKSDKHSIDQERLSTQRSIYNMLFTWDRKVLDKSRKFVKIACRIVYKAKTKGRQSTRQVK